MLAPRCRAARKSAGAFTLVELLVVIGIIAVLMGILLPSLNKARESANRAACGSNLKQWHFAMMMYHNDFKALPGPLVPATFSYEKAWTASTGANWVTSDAASAYKMSRRAMTTANPDFLLGKYFKNNQGVYVCPSNRDLYEEGRAAPGTTYQNIKFGYAYRINNQSDTQSPYFFGYWGTVASTLANPNNARPKKLSEVRRAGLAAAKKGANINSHSEIWMLSDVDGYNFSDSTSSFFGIEDGAVPTRQRKWKPIHRAGVVGRNYLFFDGHVTWYPFQFGVIDNDSEPYNGFNNVYP